MCCLLCFSDNIWEPGNLNYLFYNFEAVVPDLTCAVRPSVGVQKKKSIFMSITIFWDDFWHGLLPLRNNVSLSLYFLFLFVCFECKRQWCEIVSMSAKNSKCLFRWTKNSSKQKMVDIFLTTGEKWWTLCTTAQWQHRKPPICWRARPVG